MISLTVEKRYGAATVRTRVTAPSVEQALRLCGENARVVVPTDTLRFFAAKGKADTADGPPAATGNRHARAA